MKYIAFFIALICLYSNIYAKKIAPIDSVSTQNIVADNAQAIQMADGMYQSGKIYVVVIVILLIFASLFLYLLMIERKLTRIEKQFLDKK